MVVHWTVLAVQDLQYIHTYIAKDAPIVAGNVVRKLYNSVHVQVATVPFSAREGRVPGTREFVVPRLPYIVVYHVVGDTVDILRILHSAMKWPDSFD